MREVRKALLLAALVWLLPSVVSAQATLTGVVKDSSGSVLPGVTVEATSPALSETRTVVTDGNGAYRIIELKPGIYGLSFSLPGFNVVKRTDIQLQGTAVVTIPIDLKVGSLQETITVTGETPVVDVQSVKRETVLDSEIIEAVPGSRTVGTLLNATPGLTVDGNGAAATPTMTFFSARGGQTNEGRMSVNGLTVAAAFNGGGVSSYILDTVNADETTVTVSGGMGESDTGGPVMNIVPRAGGNTFRGQYFSSYASARMRSDNLTEALKAPAPGPNIKETPGIIKAYDASFTYSGPVKKDRVWFLGSYRRLNTQTAIEGIVANANTGDLTKWDWVQDASLPARQTQGRAFYQMRASAQVTDKNRVNFSHEYQTRCEGAPLRTDTTSGCYSRAKNWIASNGSTTTSPEASTAYIDFPYWLTQATWTNPLTNRILLEAGYSRLSYEHAGGPGQLQPDGIFDIGVTESSATANAAVGYTLPVPRTNYAYRALSQYSDNFSNPNHWRASASYVTGTHNLKVGYQGSFLLNNTNRVRNDSLLSYSFTQGRPVNFSLAIPEWHTADRTSVAALFVQDAWTRGRLTLQGALRWDRAWSNSPGGAELNGTPATSRINPTIIEFEGTKSVDAFNDLTPRFGVAYDVFGNGRTAVKFNAGHYLDAATNDSAYTRNNPANRFQSTITARGWTDSNSNKVVDCNLLNFAAQGPTVVGANNAPDVCNVLTGNNLNFGGLQTGITEVNPATLKGWGVRENDWQWGLTVQQELMPRMSIEVGYARRWFSGVTVTDDRNNTPDQYSSYVVTAPSDARLPGGGGYPITLYQRSQAGAALPANNLITFQTDYGPEETNYWHGVDVTLNARTRWGLTFSGGTSTGRSVTDDCLTAVKIGSPDPRNCHDADPFQTTFRGLASYTIPWVDVRVSGTIRSQPEVERSASWGVPNSPSSTLCASSPSTCTTIQGMVGFLPAGLNANGTTTIALVDNDRRLYDAQRRTQFDMRFAKIVRFRGTRADLGVDLWNLFNTNYATTYSNTYEYTIGNTGQGGTWNNPATIYAPRYARLNLTFAF